MPTTRVFYHDRLVGTLSMTLGNHRCVFEYSPGWLSDGFSISPLELPLKSGLLLPKTDYFYGNFGIFECSSYDTPENYRKRYYKGELPRKQTFENRVLSPEPKFVQKKRQLSDNKDTYKGVSTFEKEIPEKKLKNVYFCKTRRRENIMCVYFQKQRVTK